MRTVWCSEYLVTLLLLPLKRQGFFYGQQLCRQMVQWQEPCSCDVIEVLLVPVPPLLGGDRRLSPATVTRGATAL